MTKETTIPKSTIRKSYERIKKIEKKSFERNINAKRKVKQMVEIIEIPISKIKSNPFKKYINKGKLDNARVEQMLESIAHGTLPNNFFVRRTDGNFELCHGHHRLGAFKKKHGNSFKVNAQVVDYSDETMLVDMVRENLTHRDTDLRDTEDSVVLARAWLRSKSMSVQQLDNHWIHKGGKSGLKGSNPINGSVRDIAKFLSKKGKAISKSAVANFLSIHDNLIPKLHEKIAKLDTIHNKERESKLGIQVATILSTIPKNEQMAIYDAIKKEKLSSVDSRKAITKYKDTDETTKEMVRDGELKLEDIGVLEHEDEPIVGIPKKRKGWLTSAISNLVSSMITFRTESLKDYTKTELEALQDDLQEVDAQALKTYDYLEGYKKKMKKVI